MSLANSVLDDSFHVKNITVISVQGLEGVNALTATSCHGKGSDMLYAK